MNESCLSVIIRLYKMGTHFYSGGDGDECRIDTVYYTNEEHQQDA